MAEIAEDLEAGRLQALTFKAAKEYGLTTNLDIRYVQMKLKAAGLLKKKGNRYITAKAA